MIFKKNPTLGYWHLVCHDGNKAAVTGFYPCLHLEMTHEAKKKGGVWDDKRERGRLRRQRHRVSSSLEQGRPEEERV